MNGEKESALAVVKKPKALEVMANRLNLEPAKMHSMLKNTVFKSASDEEMMALVVVANEYGLNPMTKQLYAFPAKGGGIVPVVSIDGWVRVVNDQKNFDGCEFEWQWKKDGLPHSCTCIMYNKDRSHPVKVEEYYEECYRKSDPWDTMPRRMLRHKSFMQAGRMAFGLGGIYDPDEAKDIQEGKTVDVTVETGKPPEFIPGVSEPNATGPVEEKKLTPPKAKRKPPVRRKKKPEPEPEPQPEAVDDTETTSPMIELGRKMEEGSVSEDQVLIFCMEQEWAEGVSTLEELPDKAILQCITHWEKILPEIQSIEP